MKIQYNDDNSLKLIKTLTRLLIYKGGQDENEDEDGLPTIFKHGNITF